METNLRASRSSKEKTGAAPAVVAPPVYQEVADSAWTFSYRFAIAPEGDEESPPQPKYGGKLTVHFRRDGYTDLLQHEPGVPSQALEIVKAWGWDLEKSEEDDKEYILFSIDVIVPDDGRKERFYFQARQEQDSNGSIEFQEGTVTVKQDVSENKDGSSSFWGLFSPKGILARFTYVGNFSARPRKVE